ncbi:hypothetical protein A2914_02745 [Candidatus Nomurabacteria bacterium RIFCSPLOWO2_01_FULL_41_21]|uniref:DUF5667 domain-containing protein n=2 Tax=Candidatus Nomuraibacteriota TaxID=1752729 RepID=A0A1F6X478_9BACT|nr:MAG: hypothetical protein A2647_02380 [Candidatus Nomurabacteria bacterium RIFCSPHIGHO2_01_FULL_40_24b]OGI88853.1 MAG: hypothetical protein A2914_02745 [Candidatus Nomurabacteria bacterium RIFCSPLOWO2_01_FULL_41_21]
MKKYSKLFLVLLMAFIIGATSALAQGNGRNGDRPIPPAWRTEAKETRVEMRQEWLEHRAQVMNEMRERKVEWREEMQQIVNDKKKLARTRIAVGMMQRAENLSNIADRIQTRIEKIEAEGGDTNGAEEMVADAQEKLDDLMGMIEALKASVDEEDTTLEDIKADIAEIKALFKEVHTLLSQAVRTLKGNTAEGEEDDNEE